MITKQIRKNSNWNIDSDSIATRVVLLLHTREDGSSYGSTHYQVEDATQPDWQNTKTPNFTLGEYGNILNIYKKRVTKLFS